MWENDAQWWVSPKGNYSIEPPSIDLNSLFQYAVPKVDHYLLCNLQQQGGGHIASVILNNKDYEGLDKDPALALFWALYKVMEGKDASD